MPRHDFLTKPALHCRIALQQGAHAIAHDFADGGIGPRLDFALHGLRHVVRQSDAELLCGSYKRSFCKEALRYLKREADPQLWAATQVEVGGTHAELGIRGEGKAANEHLTDAITAYRNALEVYTRERQPQDWAAVQTNLGTHSRRKGSGPGCSGQ